jgi:hypothetical protein
MAEARMEVTRIYQHTLLAPRLIVGAAALVLLGGYADLVRGGITLAPILLVIAYCILIPWAIWTTRALDARAPGRTRTQLPPVSVSPSYSIAAMVAAGVFCLYLLTLAPSTAFWDASEYITAAYTFGLPHPPGNPFFVLLGRVFSILPIGPNVAVRVNILAALFSAISAGIWYLVAERIAMRWLSVRWQQVVTGVLASIIGATAFTVWNQSVVNEKVYTVSLIGLAIASWLAIRWAEDPDDANADRRLVMIGYVCALGYANHIAGMLPMLGGAIALIAIRPRSLLRPRLLLAGLAAMIIGFTPFATQPIRSAFNPPINEGEPTACREGLKLSCTFSKGTYDAFMYNLNREQYGKPTLDVRQAPFSAQVGMWWLYFKWQWLRDAYGEHARAQTLLAATFLVLGLLGGALHYKHDRRTFLYFGPYMATITLLLVFYLNFKYGASQAPELEDGVAREVRDRDYFFLWSFSSWGVWASLGLVWLWRTLAGLFERPRTALIACTPVLGLALLPLANNWTYASRSSDATTIAFARDLLNSIEPYGVIVTYGDNDTFPLWYAQEVEGIRKDVVVAVLSLLNTDWFLRGLIRRPVYEYDVAKGPAIYRGREWPKPNGPPIALTLAQADSLPPYVLLDKPAVMRKAGLSIQIDPRALPQVQGGAGLLERSDLTVLRMIADSWPERPMYISRTTGNYGNKLGLAPFLLRQGLADKLILPPEGSSPDTTRVSGAAWFDIDRSLALWDDVFVGPKALIDYGHWVDRPSLSIPLAYAFTGGELAESLRARGDSARASAVMRRTGALVRAVRAGPVFEQFFQ